MEIGDSYRMLANIVYEKMQVPREFKRSHEAGAEADRIYWTAAALLGRAGYSPGSAVHFSVST